MPLFAVALQFPFTGCNEANTANSNTAKAPLHKANMVCKGWVWNNSSGPNLNPSKCQWNELKRQLHTRSPCQTSVPNLMNRLVDKCVQIPTVTLNLVQSLHRRLEVIIAVKQGQTLDWNVDGEVKSTNLWQYKVS